MLFSFFFLLFDSVIVSLCFLFTSSFLFFQLVPSRVGQHTADNVAVLRRPPGRLLVVDGRQTCRVTLFLCWTPLYRYYHTAATSSPLLPVMFATGRDICTREHRTITVIAALSPSSRLIRRPPLLYRFSVVSAERRQCRTRRAARAGSEKRCGEMIVGAKRAKDSVCPLTWPRVFLSELRTSAQFCYRR